MNGLSFCKRSSSSVVEDDGCFTELTGSLLLLLFLLSLFGLKLAASAVHLGVATRIRFDAHLGTEGSDIDDRALLR